MSNLKHILALAVTLLSPLAILAQKVTNVTVQQKGEKIEVSYTLDKEADIYLTVVLENKYQYCRNVTGDVGYNVSSGRKTIVWNVLEDMEEFIGEAVFEVHASPSTKTKQALAAKQKKAEARAKRMADIYPLAGFDVSGGLYGFGTSIYWPWVSGRPSRVGSYASYVMGMEDWKDEDVDCFHNICLGFTLTLSKHVALFAAPGLSIVKTKDEDAHISSYGYDYDDYYYNYYDSSSSSTYTTYRFAVEGGISFKILCFTLSAKYAYPSYLGLGLGLDFGWIH